MSQTKDKSTARHALTLCTQETHISTGTVLSERLLLPMKILSALSKQTCHSAGHAQLFLATNWTQQLLWGHGELHGLFSGKGSSLQQRRTQALTSLDTESIRTY